MFPGLGKHLLSYPHDNCQLLNLACPLESTWVNEYQVQTCEFLLTTAAHSFTWLSP